MTTIAELKRMAAHSLGGVLGQCRFERSIFLIGLMRSGTTALSGVICSRRDVSGFGEAHVRYDSERALGQLVLAQARRRVWRPRARFLFDKLLHGDLDRGCDLGRSRQIFLAREPAGTILSIRAMDDRLNTGVHTTDTLAADYYEARLTEVLERLASPGSDRRAVLTFAELTADADAALDAISRQIALDPPLENRYELKAASVAPGAGDPLHARSYNAIVNRDLEGTGALDLPASQAARLDALYREYAALSTMGA